LPAVREGWRNAFGSSSKSDEFSSSISVGYSWMVGGWIGWERREKRRGLKVNIRKREKKRERERVSE